MRNFNNIRSKQFRLNKYVKVLNVIGFRSNLFYPFAFEILKAVQSNQHALNLKFVLNCFLH